MARRRSNCWDGLASTPTANALLLWSLRQLRLHFGLSPLAPQSDEKRVPLCSGIEPLHCSPMFAATVPNDLEEALAAKSQVSMAAKMLADEYGTASNIKSRVNRLSVLSAITSTQQRLKLFTKVRCSSSRAANRSCRAAHQVQPQHKGMQASGACVECHTVVAVTAAAAVTRVRCGDGGGARWHASPGCAPTSQERTANRKADGPHLPMASTLYLLRRSSHSSGVPCR